jgi:molecular chaperone GrpE
MTTKSTNGRTGTDSDVTVELEDVPAASNELSPEASDEGGIAAAGAPSQLELLSAKVAELEEKNKGTYERLLRTTADLDNFRKRTRREVDDARMDGRSKVLLEMLPVIDNLERAIAHAVGGHGDTKGITDGVELVLRQFLQALERFEVRPINALGQPFDPNFHEAVGQRESAEYPPGTVIEVLQRGYGIGQRLLRPALVVVSKATESSGDEASGSNGPNGKEPTPANNGSATTQGQRAGRAAVFPHPCEEA